MIFIDSVQKRMKNAKFTLLPMLFFVLPLPKRHSYAISNIPIIPGSESAGISTHITRMAMLTLTLLPWETKLG